MISAKDLSKAPYPSSWILNEKNICYKTATMALWHPKQYKQLWFYNRLYYFKEGRVFDMDHHLCGYLQDNIVYGISFQKKIELPFSIDL